jgi:mannose-6-phosphate isomerase-like protein (cupin superfamily)
MDLSLFGPYLSFQAGWIRPEEASMQEQIKLMAERIRELRELKGVPAAEMAAGLHLGEAEYQALESGEVDIPVSILHQVALRLGVELTTLLTGQEPKMHTYSVTRAGKGISADRNKDYGYQALAHTFVHKRAEPFLVTVEPGPVHPNSHPGQEFHYVLEGSLRVTVGSHAVVLGPGDSLYFDSTIAHSLTALNDRPARLLAVIV